MLVLSDTVLKRLVEIASDPIEVHVIQMDIFEESEQEVGSVNYLLFELNDFLRNISVAVIVALQLVE